MTVKELIEELKANFNDNDSVYVVNTTSIGPFLRTPSLIEVNEIERNRSDKVVIEKYTKNKAVLIG